MTIQFEMTQEEINALNELVDYALESAQDSQYYYLQAKILRDWINKGGQNDNGKE